MQSYQEISVEDLAARLKANEQAKQALHLYDVREADEYALGHPRQALHLPLSRLSADGLPAQLGPRKDEPIYLICHSGKRSARACGIFAEAGYSQLYNVSGGFLAWQTLSSDLV